MIAQFLAEIERELTEATDALDFADQDYAFNPHIDSLRDIIRKVGAEHERIKLGLVKAA